MRSSVIERLGRGTCALVVVAGLAACDPPPPPVVLTVDSTGASGDADPGDGVCAASGGGCTLPAAIEEASASEIDRIAVPAGWAVPAGTSTFTPVAPTLTITSTVPEQPVTVVGRFVFYSGTLVLRDVEIGAGSGSGVEVGLDATLALHRSAIRDRDGAGISVTTYDERTTIVLVDSTIEGGSGDGIAVEGWEGSIALVRSTISGNAGAAVELDEHGSATVVDSEVVDNGGGVGASAGDSAITIRRSTIAGNAGPAVFTTYEDVVVEDSTITGSSTGIAADSNEVVVRRSTVAGNATGIRADWSTTVDVTAATLANDVDLRAVGDAEVTVAGSILGGATGCVDADGFATFTSTGGTVAADASCGLAGPGDQSGVDPLLGALGDHGGHTPTIEPGPGSPAIDAIAPGTSGLCTPGTVDQRGVARPQGASCDAGAVEVDDTSGVIWVDSAADAPDTDPWDDVCRTAAGECTLRAAFQQASKAYDEDLDPTSSAAIAVHPGIDPVLDPALGRVRTHGNVTVDGGGATVDGGGSPGVLVGCFGTLTLRDLTVTGGGAGRAAVGNDGCSASLVLDSVTVEGNAGDGVGTDGTMASLTAIGSTVRDNTGSGIVGEVTDVVVAASTVTGNLFGLSIHATSAGTGTVSVSGSTIGSNVISGIEVREHTLTVDTTTVADNGAAGIWARDVQGPSVVRRSLLVGNGRGIEQGSDGPGLSVEDSTITHSSVAGIDTGDTPIAVSRSTVADNGGAEIVGSPYATVTLAASIVAGPGVACDEYPEDPPGQPVPVSSMGGNVVSDGTCALDGPSDQEGADPLLGALGDAGGPTWTRVPGAGSPAIDAIAPGTPGLCLVGLIDQRGVSRPLGAGCDAGAVEQ